jgi:hypothetical protein
VRLAALLLLLPMAAAADGIYRCGNAYSSDPTCGGQTAKKVEAPLPTSSTPFGGYRMSASRPAAPRETTKKSLTPFRKDPNSPLFKIQYNPANQPAHTSVSEMESLLASAARAWSSGCNVNIRLAAAGETPDVLMEWDVAMAQYKHPADGVTDVCGLGGRGGMRLNPGLKICVSLSTVTHEMGHILGIGHLHEDPNSVMSYNGRAATPNHNDFSNCNMAMKRRFGIEYEMPEGAQPTKITDAEALAKRKQ